MDKIGLCETLPPPPQVGVIGVSLIGVSLGVSLGCDQGLCVRLCLLLSVKVGLVRSAERL